MKKLLASMLLFLGIVSARALEINDLIGYWEWRGENARESAFYLHVDGTCTIIADENSTGTWTYAEDTLELTHGGATMRYSMQYTPAEESEEYRDTLHLTADGYDAYYLQPYTIAESVLREVVQGDVLALSQAYYGSFDKLEGYLEIPGAPDGEHALMLVVDDHIRVLRAFRYADGKWEQWLNSSAAVPQGEEAAQLYTLEKGSQFQYNWDLNNTHVSDGLHFGVNTSNGETTKEGISFVWRDGGFHLYDYQFKPGSYVDVVDGEMVFWNISNGDERFVKATIDTDIRTINFYALPEKPEDIVQNAANAPMISEIKYLSRAFHLLPQQPSFQKNQRCNVYLGPGTGYGRAGNGKAVVSTNDWIQVFAQHDGWLLIQYSISDSRYRIGWIEDDALKAGADIPEISLNAYDYGRLLVDAELTDDPLSSKTKLRTVPQGARVEIVAQLDDAWLYVRYNEGNKTYLGFLPVSVLEFDSNG